MFSEQDGAPRMKSQNSSNQRGVIRARDEGQKPGSDGDVVVFFFFFVREMDRCAPKGSLAVRSVT